jgi:4-hydroxybenzoate polyprenyltransferase
MEKVGVIIWITLLVAAGGYTINNYFDVATDVINNKKNRVVGLFISKKNTFITYIALTACAVCSSVVFDLGLMYWVLWPILALFLYAFLLKKLPLIGNVMVAMLSTYALILMLYPSFSVSTSLAFYLTAVCYISLIREILKDMEDIEGDTKTGAYTLPIFLGEPMTKKLIYLIFLLYQLQLFYFLPLHWLYMVYYVLFTIVHLYLVFQIAKVTNQQGYQRISDFLKMYFFMGMVLIGMAYFFKTTLSTMV